MLQSAQIVPNVVRTGAYRSLARQVYHLFILPFFHSNLQMKAVRAQITILDQTPRVPETMQTLNGPLLLIQGGIHSLSLVIATSLDHFRKAETRSAA